MSVTIHINLLSSRSGNRLMHLAGGAAGLAGVSQVLAPGPLSTVNLIGLSSGLMAWLLCALMARQLTRQQRDLTMTLTQWQQGDHRSRLTLNGLKEHALLALQLNELARNKLRQQDTSEQAIHEVAHAAGELQSRAGQVAAIADEQLASSTATAAAAEQMSASIAEIARQGSDTQARANAALSAAEQGTRLVGATSKGLGALAHTSDEIAVTLEQLSEQSKAISQITEVIRSVSEQTNLLALNASIEAARAGVHGRGFAVVADEVRQLSHGVASSAAEISSTLRNVSQTISSSVEQTKILREQAQLSVSHAQGANEALNQIQQQTHQTLASVAQIAVATEQQGAASQEIAQHITRIVDHAETQSRMANDTAGVAAHLAQLAERVETALGIARP